MQSHSILQGSAKPENRLIEDLGMDSLSLLSLMVEIEQTFGFEFDDEDLAMEGVETVDDFIRLLTKYVPV